MLPINLSNKEIRPQRIEQKVLSTNRSNTEIQPQRIEQKVLSTNRSNKEIQPQRFEQKMLSTNRGNEEIQPQRTDQKVFTASTPLIKRSSISIWRVLSPLYPNFLGTSPCSCRIYGPSYQLPGNNNILTCIAQYIMWIMVYFLMVQFKYILDSFKW